MNRAVERAERRLCGVVLAGGENRRCKPFAKRLFGVDSSKQNGVSSDTRCMLQDTYTRAASLIPGSRLFVSVSQSHLSHHEVAEHLRHGHPGTVIAQPRNKGSAPELLLPLLHIQRRYGDSVVAVFPSDQSIREQMRLMRYVRLAHIIISRDPSRLILLGLEPNHALCEHGYILPSLRWNSDGWGVYDVIQLIARPDRGSAHRRTLLGALCNTSMMIFDSGTLLRWVQDLQPDFYRHWARIGKAIGTPSEPAVIEEVYDSFETADIAKDLLQPVIRKHPGSIAVLPVSGVAWNEWGSQARTIEAVRIPSHRSGLRLAPSSANLTGN